MKKTSLLLAFVTLVIFASGCTMIKNDETLSKNKETTKKIFEAFDTGNVDALDKYIAKDAVDHSSGSMTKKTGIEGVKEICTMYHNAFPDMKTTINSMVAEGDMVMAYYTSEGTNKGAMMGMPATNKKAKFTGVDIIRFKDGMALEHWGVTDDLTMMKQLGMMGEMKEHETKEEEAKEHAPKIPSNKEPKTVTKEPKY